MNICPVCEHSQAQGDTCDNCGKQWVVPRVVAVATAPMAELETTRGAAVGNVPVAAMGELEATPYGAAPDLPAMALQDMEGTRVAAATVGPVLPLDEMDTGRAEAVGPAAAAATGPVPCRYCRHVQVSGLFCDRCGMRLGSTARAPRGQVAVQEDDWGLCQKCGTRAQNGRRCGECGAQVRLQP